MVPSRLGFYSLYDFGRLLEDRGGPAIKDVMDMICEKFPEQKRADWPQRDDPLEQQVAYVIGYFAAVLRERFAQERTDLIKDTKRVMIDRLTNVHAPTAELS